MRKEFPLISGRLADSTMRDNASGLLQEIVSGVSQLRALTSRTVSLSKEITRIISRVAL